MFSMKSRFIVAVVATAVLTLPAGAQRSFTSISAPASAPRTQRSPRFAAVATTGETFTTESEKGKIVLVQFWTTWCSLCRREQPAVDLIDKEFRNNGLVVLAINVGESRKKVTKYLAANPRACRVVLSDDTNLPAVYVATAYPMYVVIGRDGELAAVQRGALGDAGLRELLRGAGLHADAPVGEGR